MASTSFPLSSHTIGRKSSATPPPPPLTVRFSAGFATVSRGNQNASQKSSFYEVLGVQSSATCQEIKSAYRKLARVLHPDVTAYNHGEGYRASSDDFIRVHAAYATLSDPEKRAVYDSSLFRRRHRDSSPSCSPMVTRRWRDWETDQCWWRSDVYPPVHVPKSIKGYGRKTPKGRGDWSNQHIEHWLMLMKKGRRKHCR